MAKVEQGEPVPGLECEQRVWVLQEQLRTALEPYEPALSYLQALLLWEKRGHSALLCLGANVVFWFFALTSLRIVFLITFGLILVVCVDQWKSKIWPECRVARPDQGAHESWGMVHPHLLSLSEMCHHAAEALVSAAMFFENLLIFKSENPGKFCILGCAVLTFFAVLGHYVPGVVLSYFMLLFVLLWPLAVYHRLWQQIYLKMEPALQRLDFSVRGYMATKQKEREMRRRVLRQRPTDDDSDSEEELAAFCPKLDDSVVAKELTISDSEHSDAEISYTENGTFNLSRGQTPLTEGSEDFDRHSDPEESFARDLPDFPSINPEALGLDDEEDTSIGIPSTAYHSQRAEEAQLYYDQEELDAEMSLSGLPPVQNFTSDLAGLVTRGMIQYALSGAAQQMPLFSDNPPRQAKTYHRNSSSELDTDAEGDDFELLDQSELNQFDPTTNRGHQ